MKYRPEIDGLRTIAILPVIFFHLEYSWIKGGYFGVDVFFVISGFLITTLLTSKISAGDFNMVDFWTRRVKRLLPALLAVVLFLLIIYPFLLFKGNIREFAGEVTPTIFSYFNIYALFHFGDYWGIDTDKSYLLHTWSLSVEEQFYLIYPFFLFLVYKSFKNYLISLVLITFLSFVFYVYFLSVNKDYAFYLLPYRIWELGIGGILSLLNIREVFKNRSLKSLLVISGLCFIFASYFIPKFINNRYGVGAFLSVSGTGIILALCTQKDFLGKILSSKPFVYIGKLSYSLYLWHWPIIVLFGGLSLQLSNYNKFSITIFILSSTLLMSVISYHFIENNTRKGKHTLKLVAFLVIVSMSLTTYYKSDNYNIFYQSHYNKVNYHLKYFDISPTPYKIEESKSLIYNTSLSERKTIYKNAFKEEGIVNFIDGKDPELMLLGDSHGTMWASLIGEICDSLKISRSFYTSVASGPFFNIKNLDVQKGNKYYTEEERVEYAKSVVRNIEKWRPKIFIIACRWEVYGKADRERILELLNYLNSKSVKVIMFTQPPVLEFMGDKNASQYLTFLGINPINGFNYLKETSKDEIKSWNNYIRNLKKEQSNLQIYDVYDHMVKDGSVVVSKNKEIFYFDDDHLSYEGTKFHKSNIVNLLTSTLAN